MGSYLVWWELYLPLAFLDHPWTKNGPEKLKNQRISFKVSVKSPTRKKQNYHMSSSCQLGRSGEGSRPQESPGRRPRNGVRGIGSELDPFCVVEPLRWPIRSHGAEEITIGAPKGDRERDFLGDLFDFCFFLVPFWTFGSKMDRKWVKQVWKLLMKGRSLDSQSIGP